MPVGRVLREGDSVDTCRETSSHYLHSTTIRNTVDRHLQDREARGKSGFAHTLSCDEKVWAAAGIAHLRGPPSPCLCRMSRDPIDLDVSSSTKHELFEFPIDKSMTRSSWWMVTEDTSRKN